MQQNHLFGVSKKLFGIGKLFMKAIIRTAVIIDSLSCFRKVNAERRQISGTNLHISDFSLSANVILFFLTLKSALEQCFQHNKTSHRARNPRNDKTATSLVL